MDKETFTEIWNEYMEHLLSDGTLIWDCSPQLTEHLEKVADGEYNDDKIIDLINKGEL